MTRFKDFGSGVAQEAAPVSFKLHDETFDCSAQLQGRVMLNLVADSNDEDPVKVASTINNFFGYVLLPESKVRFDNLLEDPERIVTVETLSEIVTWLIEEYTGRPNQQPEV